MYEGQAIPGDPTFTKVTQGQGRVFRLTSIWALDGEIDEAICIFHDMESIVDWWSAAFMRIEVLDPGGAASIGKTVRLHTKGLLPHTFQFLARMCDGPRPDSVEIKVRGDFRGVALIGARKDGDDLTLEFDWRVEIRHPWIGTVAPLFRPILARNHRWVMKHGRTGMQREIYRRRGMASFNLPAQRMTPTFPHNLQFVRGLYGWRGNVQHWPG